MGGLGAYLLVLLNFRGRVKVGELPDAGNLNSISGPFSG